MKQLLTSLLVTSLSALSVSAQTTGFQSVAQLKESPAGSKILAFIDLIPTDQKLTEATISTYFSKGLVEKRGIDGLNAVLEDIRTNDEDLVVYQADRKKMFEYELICKSRKSDSWLSFKVYFEESIPYGIDGLELNTVRLENPPAEVLYRTKSE